MLKISIIKTVIVIRKLFLLSIIREYNLKKIHLEKLKQCEKLSKTFCLFFFPLLLKTHFLRGKWAFICVFSPSFLTCVFSQVFLILHIKFRFTCIKLNLYQNFTKFPKYVHNCKFFIIKNVALCPIN